MCKITKMLQSNCRSFLTSIYPRDFFFVRKKNHKNVAALLQSYIYNFDPLDFFFQKKNHRLNREVEVTTGGSVALFIPNVIFAYLEVLIKTF